MLNINSEILLLNLQRTNFQVTVSNAFPETMFNLFPGFQHQHHCPLGVWPVQISAQQDQENLQTVIFSVRKDILEYPWFPCLQELSQPRYYIQAELLLSTMLNVCSPSQIQFWIITGALQTEHIIYQCGGHGHGGQGHDGYQIQPSHFPLPCLPYSTHGPF